MRSLVTGGAGFIGSHLVDALIAAGDSVTVIDNFSTGVPTNLPKRSQNLQVVALDVSGAVPLASYFSGIDRVFHLAALADIVPSVERPLEYHRTNVDGTVAVLEAARKTRVKRFVYIASSSCYGIPDQYPTPETEIPDPQYPYALTKYIGEQYALHWHKIYGLPVTSCRLFNVYGPRSRTTGTYGAVFGIFLAQKLASKPFTVVGDGTQTRDFVFVSDIVTALIKASETPAAVGESINIGSAQPQRINRLCELLGGAIVHLPKRPGEPDRTHADISKARNILGWQPQVTFEDGVQIMLANIEHWRDAPIWTPELIEQATRSWFEHLR